MAILLPNKTTTLFPFSKLPSDGNPCFNGRYISVAKFTAIEEGFPLSSFEDASPELYTKAYQYTLLMEEYRKDTNIPSTKSPTKEVFIAYLKNLPDYETIHRPRIESHEFDTLYPLAVEMDSG